MKYQNRGVIFYEEIYNYHLSVYHCSVYSAGSICGNLCRQPQQLEVSLPGLPMGKENERKQPHLFFQPSGSDR